ncbi:GntR family transcriptional regulator [Nonomuraea sp. MG754425]|uniref:GntR family transcriptional regulator n=1 Tax=Nonomuraea sp. MG754425 TaxID=2570319 RepID=UPI001F21B977|nr:GntR family transcriptional regulator [Nonomuraea sp. MG754425]MCF6470532.1 GntR family transcriptional regulator [Nonomuraea sp. MG754425]
MPRPRHEPRDVAPELFSAGEGGPKGKHIQDVLAALVLDMRDGALLPSERVLAERFGVARMTVRGAINDLEGRGLVRRVAGRGTFVQHPTLIHSENFRSFSEDMRMRGMVPGAKSYRGRTRPAPRDIAPRLGLSPGEPIHSIERVRTADGVPMALERTNLSAERFPGLLAAMGRDDSLFEILGREFGVRLETAEQTVSIARLSPAEAKRLEVPDYDPAFLVERVAVDNMGNVVEYGRSLYRGDRYVIQMHVSRPSAAR